MINIEIICKGRGQGKTRDLILESARTGTPILTAYDSRYIVQQANDMGIKIKQPMTRREYEYFRRNGSLSWRNWNGKLLIDEVDGLLRQMLDADIEKATCTPDSMNKKENKNMPTKSFDLELMGINNIHFYITKPEIKDVNIIVPDKVVEVTFADGTKEKSVCKEPDTFSLESAISICISKKIMGGSSAYNNAVKRGMKVYEDKQKREAAEKEEQERIEKKRAKRLAYKERMAAKRAEEENQRKAREREEQIAIRAEAYLRVLDIIRNENRECSSTSDII